MVATWEKHEGQAVDGIPLLRLLGSTDASAVYLAEIDGRRCALKIVPADGIAAPTLLARWRRASELSHPHLTQLLRWGTARLQSQPVAYAAMEYAEEVLADVDRPVTPKEARDMLAPAVAALAYLHAQGMAHGRVKASNVLSAGDVLKISGDAPRRIGERPPPQSTPSPYDSPELQTSGATAAGDVWSVGVAVVEGLTKELPRTETMPPRMPESPFLDELRPMIEGCLQRDPALRWSMEDIGHWLRHGVPLRKPALKSSKSRYWAPASVGAAAAMVIGAIAFEHRATPPAPSIPVAPKVAEPSPVPPTSPPVQTNPAPPADVLKPRQPAAASGVADVVSAGIQPVLPKVPDKARLTIHGKVRVSVRVETDPTGAVTSAMVQSGTSKYFVDLALKAARQWRFASGGARAWTIRFVFTRDEDQPVSAQAAPAP
jgi:serine/threonine protein kinase